MTRKLSDENIKTHYDKLVGELVKEIGVERSNQISTLIEYALIRVLNTKVDKFIDKYLDLGTEDLYQFYKLLPKPIEVKKDGPGKKKGL